VVILLGDRGTGKTVMATYLAGMLGTGMYIKACDLFRKIRGTFGSDSKLTEADVLRPFETCEFLVIDEAQERKKDSDWELVTLTNLIDKRYDRFKSTAIIANRLTGRLYPARNRRFRYDPPIPDLLDKLVSRHDAASVFDQ
jgi:DNA replication protein DnaC